MSNAEKQYLSLVEEVLTHGEQKEDRTGVGTISLFGMQRKYDLREGFPLLTTKKVLFTGILHELLWFLRGSTNINENLTQHTPIWNAWAKPDGELGPIYGFQWRHFGADYQELLNKKTEHKDDLDKAYNEIGGVDQIKNLIHDLKHNPHSRRLIVSAWNVAEIENMALPPCHLLFQFYVVNGRLDCQLYQRSADIALGVPFNIASYATLMHMLAQECGYEAGIFTHTMGDAHIYLNHVEGLKEQLTRKAHPLPQLKIAKKPFWDLEFSDFEIVGYEHEPFIKFEVAV